MMQHGSHTAASFNITAFIRLQLASGSGAGCRRSLLAAAPLWLIACVTGNPDYCADSPECAPSLGSSTDEDLGGGSWHTDMHGPFDGMLDGSGFKPLDPDQPGPLRTARLDLQVPLGTRSSVETTLIGPSEDGMELSRRGPFPLVVISPGFTLDRKQFQSYGDRLASYGIVAVLQKSRSEFNHAQYRDDTVALLDWLISPTGPDASRVAGRADKDRIGLAGHSLGGKISLLVAEKDARVKAVLGIDPVDAGTPQARADLARIKLPLGIPLFYIGETTSKTGGLTPCTPADANYEVLYTRSPTPALAITVSGAAHNDFVDSFMRCGSCGFCPGGSAPKDRTNRLAVKYCAAYFLWALKDDPRGADYLLGAGPQRDTAAGYVTVVKK